MGILSEFTDRIRQLGFVGLHFLESRQDLDERLYPEEQEYIRHAAPKRFHEFRTVRALAREGLAELGHARPPMVPGEWGEPMWPAGIVGSITHCDGYRAIVVAERAQVRSVGIDAEPNRPLPSSVYRKFSSALERDYVRRLEEVVPQVCGDILLFSVKESIYKAWFPMTHTRLRFDQVCVQLLPNGSFHAVLLELPRQTDAILHSFDGRWDFSEGVLRTIVDLAAPAALITVREVHASRR